MLIGFEMYVPFLKNLNFIDFWYIKICKFLLFSMHTCVWINPKKYVYFIIKTTFASFFRFCLFQILCVYVCINYKNYPFISKFFYFFHFPYITENPKNPSIKSFFLSASTSNTTQFIPPTLITTPHTHTHTFIHVYHLVISHPAIIGSFSSSSSYSLCVERNPFFPFYLWWWWWFFLLSHPSHHPQHPQSTVKWKNC